MNLMILDTSHKWIHTRFVLLYLDFLTEHNVHILACYTSFCVVFFFLFFWEWHVFGNCYSQMLSSERERYNKALELAQKKASWCPWLCSMLVLSAVLVSLYLLSGLLLETALISSMSLCWSPVTRQSWKNVGCHFLDRDLRVLSLHFFIYEKWIMTGVHVHVDIHVYVYMCVCPCVFRNTRSCSEQHPATSFFF